MAEAHGCVRHMRQYSLPRYIKALPLINANTGTSKGLSDSPLINDPNAVRALHLIPPTPDQGVSKEYFDWKKREHKQGPSEKAA